MKLCNASRVGKCQTSQNTLALGQTRAPGWVGVGGSVTATNSPKTASLQQKRRPPRRCFVAIRRPIFARDSRTPANNKKVFIVVFLSICRGYAINMVSVEQELINFRHVVL